MNYKMIRYIVGMILVAESVFMVLPMLVSVFYGEYNVLMPFVYMAIIIKRYRSVKRGLLKK